MPKAKTDATDSTQTSFHTADTTTGQMTFAIIQTNFGWGTSQVMSKNARFNPRRQSSWCRYRYLS